MTVIHDTRPVPAPGAERASDDAVQSERRAAIDLEVVIPAYNETARLPATLHGTIDFLQAQRWTSRVVVVDNNSADDTGYIVQRGEGLR